MGLGRVIQNLERLDTMIAPMLRAARIPGAALAVVVGDETVFANGYGYRDLDARLPTTSDTVYPIASTTKAINATLLGTLVDEERLAWDRPVQDYLPHFRLQDSLISARVTLRDLLVMRTGLPRHDWLWIDNPINRAAVSQRLRYLEPSAGFRERFQYNNLTVTTAGYIAEVVTGQSWEELVKGRLLEPLRMSSTEFALPKSENASLSYHETSGRELKLTHRLASEVTAPSGGTVHSTVRDMARWMSFNLSGGKVGERPLISQQTLVEIHSPQIVVGADATSPTPNAAYAMGWFVDTYNGCARLSHGGYLHDVNSDVMLFPKEGIGVVSFTNFGFPTLSRLLNEHAFDLLMSFKPVQSLEQKLAQYEEKIAATRQRIASVRRVEKTMPSHSLNDYVGAYVHPGYGAIQIEQSGQDLVFQRNQLHVPLERWHYDVWMARETDIFYIHVPHAFDRSSRLLFETDEDGSICAVSIRFEPAVAPIRFIKQ